eukprot:CAMPEP_0119557402 /NCGR_PEP_ID=MMETSP1352-20130426/9076_1 /TAXON_ID=265584 /ORGANISM="Stauroneis constricta, Strain CCMP1120" /LENGTH=167 /DNA_ID=CAMNT_0007604505 /DNA_START=139 /DNA_END=642 /DNA_ORIENTATION=+
MDEDENRVVKLMSKDGKDFEITAKAAQLSVLVKDTLEESEKTEVEIMRVDSKCLEKVVEFLKHYAEEEMREIGTPLRGSTFIEIMDQKWYQEFVSDDSISREMLFELLTAANYMGIKPLLDLACLKITFQLTGKSADEIRGILNLPEMTEEEERRAREEHKWIFEDN